MRTVRIERDHAVAVAPFPEHHDLTRRLDDPEAVIELEAWRTEEAHRLRAKIADRLERSTARLAATEGRDVDALVLRPRLVRQLSVRRVDDEALRLGGIGRRLSAHRQALRFVLGGLEIAG